MSLKPREKKARSQSKFLLELWDLRFSKLLEGESEAYRKYGQLLLRNQAVLSAKAVEVLSAIKEDEAKHIRLADQLLGLVRKKQAAELIVSGRTYESE